MRQSLLAVLILASTLALLLVLRGGADAVGAAVVFAIGVLAYLIVVYAPGVRR